MSRPVAILIVLLFTAVLAAVGAWFARPSPDGSAGSGAIAAAQKPGTGPIPGGPFALTDHHGQVVTDRDFRGQYLFVYFGYTNCPDVCPTTLYDMSQALDRLGPRAERVTPLFITIDPERDTADALADYVPAFHPRLVGLTGTLAAITAVATAYHTYFKKVPPEPGDETAEPGWYTMDHSPFVYLMAPDGKFREVFGHGTTPKKMAKKILEIMSRDGS